MQKEEEKEKKKEKQREMTRMKREIPKEMLLLLMMMMLVVGLLFVKKTMEKRVEGSVRQIHGKHLPENGRHEERFWRKRGGI